MKLDHTGVRISTSDGLFENLIRGKVVKKNTFRD